MASRSTCSAWSTSGSTRAPSTSTPSPPAGRTTPALTTSVPVNGYSLSTHQVAVNLDGSKGYDPLVAYGMSKVANGLFSRELARRLHGATNATSNSLHPGVIETNLGRHRPPRDPRARTENVDLCLDRFAVRGLRCGLRRGLLVEALAQACRGRHPRNAQRLAEEEVIANAFHGFEIILALAQQAQVGSHKIDMRNAMAQRHRLQALLEPAVAVDDRANDGQAAGRRINFGVALLENERHREGHLLGEMARSGRCVILLNQGAAKCVRSADEVTDSGDYPLIPLKTAE